MFGMGMGEIIIIAIVALLALGPDKLPEAAKKIGEAIRGLRKQTTELRKTIEDDTQLGDAMREIRSALREDPLAPSAKPAKPGAVGPASPDAPTDAPTDESSVAGSGADEPLVKPADNIVSRDEVDVTTNAAPSAPSEPAPPVALSEYERYIHNNGTEAASEKFGTSLEHAEAAMVASLERTSHNG